MKTVQESMKEVENKKRALEETMDTLNEKYATLKAQGELSPTVIFANKNAFSSL